MRTPKLTRYLKSRDETLILEASQALINGSVSAATIERSFGHLLEGAQGLTPGVALRHYLGDEVSLSFAQVVTLALLSATGRLTTRKSLTLSAHASILSLEGLQLPALEQLTVWGLEAEHLEPLQRLIAYMPNLRRIKGDATLSFSRFEAITEAPRIYQLMGGARLTLNVLRHRESHTPLARYLVKSHDSRQVWDRAFKGLFSGVEGLRPGMSLREQLGYSRRADLTLAEPITLAMLQVTGRLEQKRKITARATSELLSLTPHLPSLRHLDLIGLHPAEVSALSTFISGAPNLERVDLDQISDELYQELTSAPRLLELLGDLSARDVAARQEEQVSEESLNALFTSRSAGHIHQAIELGLLMPADQIGARFSFAGILEDSQVSNLIPGSRLRRWLSGREPQLPDGSRVSADLAQLVLIVIMRLSGRLKRLKRLKLSANPLFTDFDLLNRLEGELLSIPKIELATWSPELLVELRHTPRLLDKLIKDNQDKKQSLKPLKSHLERLAEEALAGESLSARRHAKLKRLACLALGEEVAELDGDALRLRLCPAGVFTMGNPTPPPPPEGYPERKRVYDASSDEFHWVKFEPPKHPTPLHEVEISRPLLVSQTVITKRQWDVVMNSMIHQDQDRNRERVQFPACCDWPSALRFCNRLSELHKLEPVYELQGDEVKIQPNADGYRLLSEAEWEYVARAGEDHEYAGSSIANHVGWFYHNTRGRAHPVAQKTPNAWGLYDCSGNYEEWCQDTWLLEGYHQRVATLKQRGETRAIDPLHIDLERPERVTKGGSYRGQGHSGRVSVRSVRPWRALFIVTLRIARAL